jgi:hypothetical protein
MNWGGSVAQRFNRGAMNFWNYRQAAEKTDPSRRLFETTNAA